MNSNFHARAKGYLKLALILCGVVVMASCGGGGGGDDAAAAFTVNVTGF